jgi:hypothetical protein
MEPLEFDFGNNPARGFLDLVILKNSGYTQTMTKVQLLEREIRKLDQRALGALRDWFRRYDAAAWDRQIGRDARSGKLKKFSEEALADHRSGKTRAL